MSKVKVRRRDPGAKAAQEPYYADLGPSGGWRYYVKLSDGRRMPWGATMAHAWRRAEQRLALEESERKVQAFYDAQAQRNLERDIYKLESNDNAART